jgi:hypothetical protein
MSLLPHRLNGKLIPWIADRVFRCLKSLLFSIQNLCQGKDDIEKVLWIDIKNVNVYKKLCIYNILPIRVVSVSCMSGVPPAP